MKTIKNYDNFVNEAKKSKNESIIEKFLDAARTGNSKLITSLLDSNNVDVNSTGNTRNSALMWAAYKGRVNIVNILLSRGADVNRINIEGVTALMLAASVGHNDIIDLLIDHVTDINIQSNNGWTALTWSAYYRYKNTVKLLLSHTAGIDFKTKQDYFAIDYECEGIWKTKEVQELIILKQPWNIKFFDDHVGFLPELKVKYKDAFYISDLNI